MEIRDHMPHAYARRLAGKISKYLKTRYGASRVMLFGTLAGGFFNPDFSDIKVGFEGVRDYLLQDAMADCRFRFGWRDRAGIRRLDLISLSSLERAELKRLIAESEEI